MIDVDKLDQRTKRLNDKLKEKLGLRGKTLEKRLKRAGRTLPKHLRREGAIIVQAQKQVANPKMARLIDQAALDRSFAMFRHYLKDIDPVERRKDKIINFLGLLVFNLVVIAALYLLFLLWKGLV
ncbi:hypothetical protein ROA7450_01196 [Roseovarius albus]|uniref:Uncharacterized protein n=1 Tax=Roseovarius albus TaxID=1247867 RepID=A0A1X6YQX5_9RHOB|nr:hypothetical protein [Roseovarius albus]SLN28694.1 hypothetical protein ROA7450_01196 [Roseovarius albus]